MKIDMHNALKLAISVPLALLLALSFGWEKPYWAATTVIILSTNESFGHSLKTGRQRILGAALGALLAFTLVSLFPQDPALFITAFVVLAAILVYLGGCVHQGYLFKMAFIVCTLIAMVGNFDNVTTFNIAITRVQETILGVMVFTFVYTFLWPQKTQAVIENQFTALTKSYRQLLVDYRFNPNANCDLETFNTEIEKTKSLLALPLHGSYDLTSNLAKLHVVLASFAEAAEHLEHKAIDDLNWHIGRFTKLNKLKQPCDIDQIEFETLSQLLLDKLLSKSEVISANKRNLTLFNNYQQRLISTLQNVSVIIAAFLLWIYMPVPGGTIFPMLVCVLSNAMTSMPRAFVHHIITGFLFFSVLVLLQFVLILPSLTEAWQLALFYFVNLVGMSIGCDILKQPLQKMIGPQLLVVFTNGPLHLTPSFDIQTPLIMMVFVFLSLALTKFFMDLISLDG